MIKFLRRTALAVACIAAFSSSASSADFNSTHSASAPSSGVYIRGDIGVSFSDAENQPSTEEAFAVGGGLGYRFNEMFRADVTFDGVFDYGFEILGTDVDVDVYSVMANVYVDLPVDFIVQPYLGVGIGWAWLEADTVVGNFENDDIALAAMAGFSIDLAENTAIDLGYKLRYVDTSGYWIDHMIRAGLRFSF